TPLMSGRSQTGSARSQAWPAASPTSAWRESAAIGQPPPRRGKCRSSCARRPAPPPGRRSPRPSSFALPADRRCRPSRGAAGSSMTMVSGAGIAGSAVADLDDLVLAGAAGRLDGDDVALVLADQRARHRRRDRDLAVLDVGLEVADDLVALLRATVFVGQQHGGAEHHLVADLQRGHVDHLRVRELALELLDAALDEALLLARGVVFRVFLQVAVRTRLGDRIDDGRTLDALQLFQL